MKVTGIIAEFNPFHNGHKYLVNESKKITGSDFSVAIMSGNFTQQGNISIYDKFKRAKVATKNGVDLVVELPTIFATSSAEYFATGAINILNKLNIVDSICFGSECGDIKILQEISNILLKNENYILSKTKELMKTGISFVAARGIYLKELLDLNQYDVIDKSNNILALEYIKSIKKINSHIIPYTIKREGNNFNDNNITKTSYSSATSIRNSIYNNSIENLESTIPKSTLDLIKDESYLSNEHLFYILKYSILMNKENLKNINGIVEGLENKIYNAINISTNYNEFIHNIKSKRYSMASIKRILLNIILNISKKDFAELTNNDINYIHVLSMSEKGKILLSEISKKSNIQILTSINDNVINSLNSINKKSINLDILASNIYSSLLNENINKDYTNRL